MIVTWGIDNLPRGYLGPRDLQMQKTAYNWYDAVAVLAEPEVRPGFSATGSSSASFLRTGVRRQITQKGAGLAPRISVVTAQAMVDYGNTKAVLRDIADYGAPKWSAAVDGMAIFSR